MTNKTVFFCSLPSLSLLTIIAILFPRCPLTNLIGRMRKRLRDARISEEYCFFSFKLNLTHTHANNHEMSEEQETNASSSSDFSYLFFRNGANFRINYHEIDEQSPTNLLQPSPLIDLCCTKIVQNLSLTDQACRTIPKELFARLFRAALRSNHDDTCINTLISHWPYRIFRLEDFVDEKLTSLKMLLCEKTALQRTKQAIKYSVIIIPRFIDSIRQQQQQLSDNKHSNLRILDVTNFPVVELIIRYISTHCRLAEKESRRNQLIDIYNQQHHQLSNSEQLEDLTGKGERRVESVVSLMIFRFSTQ